MGLPGSAIAVFRRHPLRLGLALLGLLLAAGAGASLVATWTCCEPRQPAASGAIEFQSLAGSERELAWGLEQRDLALLRAALPGARVGGMRLLQVRELVPPVDAQVAPVVAGVDPQWIEARLGELLRGRALDEQDERDAAAVCLLSRTLAETLFGPGSPIGQHLRLDGSWFTVVGVFAPAAASGAGDLPDLLVPLSAALARLVGSELPQLSSVVVGAPRGALDAAQRELASRLLERAHDSRRDWSLVASSASNRRERSLLVALRGCLGLLFFGGLVLAGLGFESGYSSR